MIVFLVLLWGCQQTTNGVDSANDSWITGAVDRPSVTNGNQEGGEYDDDPDDQEENGTETFAAYFAELSGVSPNQEFESGEFGFMVLEFEYGDVELICVQMTTISLVEVRSDCSQCEFAFTVELSEFEMQGDDDLCFSYVDLSSMENTQIGIGYGSENYYSNTTGQWQQQGLGEWQMEEGYLYLEAPLE